MALTFRRWVTIVVLVCAAVAIWQLPPRGEGAMPLRQSTFPFGEVARGYVSPFGWPDASTKLGAATLHLRVLQLRDSVFTPRVLVAADSGMTVLTDRQFPDSVRRFVSATIRQAWQSNHPGHQVPVIVAVVLDTTTTLDGLPIGRGTYGNAHVFPPDSVSRACRVLVREDRGVTQRYAKQMKLFARSMVLGNAPSVSGSTILGPCLLYATYGTPGPAVAAWLSQTDWRSTRAIAANRQSPTWLDEYWYTYSWRFGGVIPGADEADVAWDTRSWLSDNGIACIAGNDARCVDGFVAPVVAIKSEHEWQHDIIDIGSSWSSWGFPRTETLGPASGWLVSDMIHDLGPDRFEKFWQSSTPPRTAFEAAAQQPLGSWLHAWATRTYGQDVLGPFVATRGLVAGVLVLLFAIVVAMLFARERRVA